jgi:hypothetical protein
VHFANVLIAARSVVHSRMNCKPHQRKRGFKVGLTRIEVFSPNKDLINIFGAQVMPKQSNGQVQSIRRLLQ